MASVKKVRWTYKGVTREVWAVKYIDDAGKRRQRIPKSGLKKDADALRLIIEREIGDGTHVARSASIAVEEAFDEWLIDCQRRHRIGDGITGQTLNCYRHDAKHVVAEIGGLKLIDLTTDKAQAMVNGWLEHLGRPTVKNRLFTIRAMLSFAVSRKRLKRNPLKDDPVKLPRTRHRVEIPTKEDIQKLLTTLAVRREGERPDVYRVRVIMVMLTMFAGLRRGEVFGLQWGDVDFAKGVLNIRHSLSTFDGLKTPKSFAGIRTVPMAPPVAELLARQHAMAGEPSSGYVLCRPDGSPLELMRASMADGYWIPLCKAAGLVKPDGTHKFRLHDMRHTAVSLWLDAGLDPVVLKGIVGHSRISTTIDIYGHLFKDDERSRLAADKAAAQFSLPPPDAMSARPTPFLTKGERRARAARMQEKRQEFA